MESESGVAEFKMGIALLRDGQSSEALEQFQKAAELKRQNPYYLSFLGVAVARAQRKWSVAVDLCKTAVSLQRNEAQMYLNLSQVYLAAGRRDDAVSILDAGMRYCKNDVRIKHMRRSMGRRETPVLPFLERGNFLNRNLGKLRHRARVRLGKADV